MRLLVIECGISNLSKHIVDIANSLRPKPEMISTMNLHIDKFNVPEFKNMLFHLNPTEIVIHPAKVDLSYSIRPETNARWRAMIAEVIRHSKVVTGRILLTSSWEVLDSVPLRTEAAVARPISSRIGEFLLETEHQIMMASRYDILRFPKTEEDVDVNRWLGNPQMIGDNQYFTLVNLHDMATVILDRLQTGWSGLYHATPNDRLLLSDVIELAYSKKKKVLDNSLASKHTWSMTPSIKTWESLGDKKNNPQIP